jgi:hypothetical protein
MDSKQQSEPGLPSDEPLLPAVLRARESVRILIPNSGCEIASRLLALDLLEGGHAAAVVTGRFARGEERIPHTWVEVEGRVLDPTQEQFSVPPEAEADEERYVERAGRLTERGEIEASLKESLTMQTWNERRRQLVEEVARRHALAIDTHALLEARGPLMARIATDVNSGKLSVTPISELKPADAGS